MLATLAEHERELVTERVKADIAAAKQNDTKFGSHQWTQAITTAELGPAVVG